jgi:hypothetical protein
MGIEQALRDALQTHTNKQFIADLEALTAKLWAPGKRQRGQKKSQVQWLISPYAFNLHPFIA